jgi:hypothetical protein
MSDDATTNCLIPSVRTVGLYVAVGALIALGGGVLLDHQIRQYHFPAGASTSMHANDCSVRLPLRSGRNIGIAEQPEGAAKAECP